MSLNNIQLEGRMLADLYTEVLVETETPAAVPPVAPATKPAPPPEAPALKYLGNNRKNILLLVLNENAAFVTDSELSFLTSVLAACKLSLADVALLNIARMNGEAVQGALDNLQARSVLMFGVEPLSIDLPMNFPQFQLQAFNKRTYLYSPSLQELENDKALKGKLWNALKTLFGI